MLKPVCRSDVRTVLNILKKRVKMIKIWKNKETKCYFHLTLTYSLERGQQIENGSEPQAIQVSVENNRTKNCPASRRHPKQTLLREKEPLDLFISVHTLRGRAAKLQCRLFFVNRISSRSDSQNSEKSQKKK